MPVQVRIRSARADEREILGFLKLRSSLAWDDAPAELQSLPEARQVPSERLQSAFVAELAGEIVGFATVLPKGMFEAELEDLFVAPNAWRKGVGSSLLAEAERRAAAVGARTLHVVANRRAQAFYVACGFEVVGTVMTRFEAAPVMRKKLA